MLTLQADASETQPSVPCPHSTYRPYLLSLSCSLQTAAVRSVFHKPHMTGQTEMQAAETPGARPVGAGLLQPQGTHLGAVGPSQHPAPLLLMWPMWAALRGGVSRGRCWPWSPEQSCPFKVQLPAQSLRRARDTNPGTRLLTPGLGCGPSTVTQ